MLRLVPRIILDRPIKQKMTSGTKFRWMSAADTCQIWNENFELVHKFEEVQGNWMHFPLDDRLLIN